MQITDCTKNINKRGFTIIELLLVIIIAGAILAVVVPRAYRANVNSKYTLVRQNCTELASNANMWAERMFTNQPVTSTAKLFNYMRSLARNPNQNYTFIAKTAASNWNSNNPNNFVTAGGITVTAKLEDLMSVAKKPRNPFNGASVFLPVNSPLPAAPAIPGAIACARRRDTSVSGRKWYFALIYQGTDNTGTLDFYAGMDEGDIEGLRNGVFIALLEQNQ